MINIEKLKTDLWNIISDEPKYESYDATVDQVLKRLADEGMGFADEKAELPEYDDYYPHTTSIPRYNFARRSCWSKGQLQMLNNNFKKFIPLKDLLK